MDLLVQMWWRKDACHPLFQQSHTTLSSH
jgi:hypothetical protein